MKQESVNSVVGRPLLALAFAFVWLLLNAIPAGAQLTVHDVKTTDVTSSGFSVVWRTSESAIPHISVFADDAGTNDISTQLETRPIPLYAGNPEAGSEYLRDVEMEDLRNSIIASGTLKISVQGCEPGTFYYFRIFSDTGIETVTWPESGTVPVKTMDENAFVQDSRQILVSLNDNDPQTDGDFRGTLLTVSSDQAVHPVSAYVGDGCAMNEAYLDLNNLFDVDEDNWTPTGLEVLTLEIRMPRQPPLYRGLTVFYSDTFHVSKVETVDINLDEAGDETPPMVWASLPGDTYFDSQTVTLEANEASYIFYTTDTTDPTTDSLLYTDPIHIGQTTTLRFMALDMAGNPSGIVTEAYTIFFNGAPHLPGQPEPVDGAVGISIETALGWQGGDPDPGDTVTYDVYLGPSDSPSLSSVCQDLTVESCVPASPLLFNTSYHWQVTAKDGQEETTGPVWQFTTFAYDGDEDGDGLNNEDEISWGTDPYAWDTDRDGYSDGEEVAMSTNAMDRTQRPPYPPKFGDIDGDWDIDGMDLSLLVSALGMQAGDEGFLIEADFNADGIIDAADLDLFARVLGYAFSAHYDPAADFDDDGDVDGTDLTHLVAGMGLQEGDGAWNDYVDADLNRDNQINHWDVSLFSIAYGTVNQ